MSGYDKNKQILMFGIRTTGSYGDDVPPTAAILVSNVNHTALAGSTVSRDNYKGFLGATGSQRATNYQEVSFDVELASSGTAGEAPAFGELLRACGLAETITAVTDVQYTPIDTGYEDGTLYYYFDAVLHKLTGARGSVEFMQDLGGFWKMQFKFVGLYNDAEIAVPSSKDTTAFKKPLVANSQTIKNFTFFGLSTLRMTKLSVNPGIQVGHFDATNQEEVEIFDRAGSMSTTIREPALGTIDFFKKTKDGDSGSLTVQLGDVAGNIVLLTVPNIQLNSTVRGEEQGKSNLAIGGDIVPTAANLDFVLTLK